MDQTVERPDARNGRPIGERTLGVLVGRWLVVGWSWLVVVVLVVATAFESLRIIEDQPENQQKNNLVHRSNTSEARNTHTSSFIF